MTYRPYLSHKCRIQRGNGCVQENPVYRVGRRGSTKDSSSLAVLYDIHYVVVRMVSHQYPDFNNAEGIIFVVDSSDRDRISEAKEELHMLMNNDQLRDSLLR